MNKTIRLAGRVTDWNDDRGFGFVVPNGGGNRAFVQINAFQRGSARPIDGSLISYLPVHDSKGRLQACEIRYAGQNAPSQRRASRFPRTAIGTTALIALAFGSIVGAIHVALSGIYFALSALSYLIYALDKAAAGKNIRRTPESRLHLIAILGGWPGALVAQQQFRHKTIKQPFQGVFWVTVVLNLTGVWWLASSGTLPELRQWLSG